MSPTKSTFGNRVPKQVQRCLPLYIAFIVFIILITNLDLLGSGANHVKRDVVRKSKSRSTAAAVEPVHFPKKIWQTWKVDALAFEERDLSRARTWTAKNPGYRYEVLTDNNDIYYVEQHFGPEGINRPDIVDMYRSLSARIIKADLLRYLVMYVEGGVYADIDVENLKPIDRWIPKRFDEADLDIVIGIEVDQPEFSTHPILGQKSRSFCQWTFMCKPGNPLMMRLVDGILDWLNEIAKKEGKPISEITLDFDDVLTGTGPSAFTIATLAEMSMREGKEIEWDTFHNLDEAVLVGGILVLNVEAFAAGQGHSDSGNHNSRFALVKHRYHASGWPSSHPRHTHPAYGEVEKCNWNAECVAMWDVNTAAYEKLSEDDKAKMIEIKKANDILEKEKADQEARFLEMLEKQESEKPKFDGGPQLPRKGGDQAPLVAAGPAPLDTAPVAAPPLPEAALAALLPAEVVGGKPSREKLIGPAAPVSGPKPAPALDAADILEAAPAPVLEG
ncbi:nucleotide-diphospho-sugar transferase [Rhexocercosporidium sp. MPI-PUGE-AT-0058]|nr:nucleotide-diphospho-sugar transferase [Rhexocercosporidium sp. MPI-PUGE-AT-0058]